MGHPWSYHFNMIGVIGPVENEGEGSFGKSFAAALFECLFEAMDLIPCALILLLVGFGLYLVGSMVYGLMYDPNAVDVAARLDALSIDPGKWMPRS
ncbi:MAG TPA: hypothetical protein VE377_20650 [Candidatus Dormibacteraeota bacterium]|nr:hypothetical protein [Candidatus Dormibacteraeota bacterium]